MKPAIKAFVLLVAIFAVAAIAAVAYISRVGLSAKSEPGALETTLARNVRGLALPRSARDLTNPVAGSDDVIAAGRAHFADHCASCHANDGSGDTEMGRGLYPKAPDMRLAPTQDLTDGELFYIIENGIRFTGMPGWGNGTPAGQEASWHLVHFIRHLPKLTEDDLIAMEAVNPRPPAEVLEEVEEQRFLNGEDLPAGVTPPAHAH